MILISWGLSCAYSQIVTGAEVILKAYSYLVLTVS